MGHSQTVPRPSRSAVMALGSSPTLVWFTPARSAPTTLQCRGNPAMPDLALGVYLIDTRDMRRDWLAGEEASSRDVR